MYTTRRTILEGLCANAEKAWRDFDEFYRPLLYLIVRKYDLTKNDIEDIWQEVLIRIYRQKVTERYDASKAKFRTYLATIITNECKRFLARKRGQFLGIGTDVAEIDIPVASQSEEEQQENDKEYIFELAVGLLRKRIKDEKKFMAFQLGYLQKKPLPEVMKILNMNEDAVKNAMYRGRRALTAIIKELEDNV